MTNVQILQGAGKLIRANVIYYHPINMPIKVTKSCVWFLVWLYLHCFYLSFGSTLLNNRLWWYTGNSLEYSLFHNKTLWGHGSLLFFIHIHLVPVDTGATCLPGITMPTILIREPWKVPFCKSHNHWFRLPPLSFPGILNLIYHFKCILEISCVYLWATTLKCPR